MAFALKCAWENAAIQTNLSSVALNHVRQLRFLLVHNATCIYHL